MDCKCPECVAAAAAFSVNDLRAIKSNITYGARCTGMAAPSCVVRPSSHPDFRVSCFLPFIHHQMTATRRRVAAPTGTTTVRTCAPIFEDDAWNVKITHSLY